MLCYIYETDEGENHMERKLTPLQLIAIIILVIVAINVLQLVTGLIFTLIKFALPVGVIAFIWYYYTKK